MPKYSFQENAFGWYILIVKNKKEAQKLEDKINA